jgi:UDPglucose--hexose-1-phosphate uridylyltransferase
LTRPPKRSEPLPPEFRRDPLTGRFVIVAPERARRPQLRGPKARERPPASCPFCPGNESMTPPELLARRAPGSAPDTPGWSLRVVPNKYPALAPPAFAAAAADLGEDRGPALGAHEVIIESARHEVDAAKLGEAELTAVLDAYRERILALRAAGSSRHVLIFKNQGREAGATIPHPHSQLVGLPFLPPALTEELKGAARYAAATSGCFFCDLGASRAGGAGRVALETRAFLAVCPFASRFPFETWILPRRHAPDFEGTTDEALRDLAGCLASVFRRLDRVLGRSAFNAVLHTIAPDEDGARDFHWHFEILPKVAQVAGFEWGSGLFVNPVAPEEAARRLRDAV